LNTALNIAIIITSIALIASIMLQSKGVGLGSLSGGDSGGVYTQRRGIDKVLFYVTIGLSVLFLVLALISVFISGLQP
jgi:preprotein translocase subunit SecG